MTLLSVIVFIIILSLLVLVHEFGHFIVAKKSGMEVEEFGFGFPPRLFGFKHKGTIYSVNAIPVGGFVKILGENNEDLDNPKSFVNKGFWPRFLSLIAGVAMNFVLAWVLISIALTIGLPFVISQGDVLPAHATLHSEGISIIAVAPNSPAANAGVQEADQVLAVNGEHFSDLDQIANYIHTEVGKNVDLELQRGNQTLDLKMLVRQNPPANEGAIGVELANVGRISLPWYYAPIYGVRATYQMSSEVVGGFASLLKSGNIASNVGGPIRIASLTNRVTKLGLVYVIQFAALLSINLGILNLVPFPALDGGRVLFLLIEKVRGKRNNQFIEQWFNAVGFALLILLLIVVSFHDVFLLIHK